MSGNFIRSSFDSFKSKRKKSNFFLDKFVEKNIFLLVKTFQQSVPYDFVASSFSPTMYRIKSNENRRMVPNVFDMSHITLMTDLFAMNTQEFCNTVIQYWKRHNIHHIAEEDVLAGIEQFDLPPLSGQILTKKQEELLSLLGISACITYPIVRHLLKKPIKKGLVDSEYAQKRVFKSLRDCVQKNFTFLTNASFVDRVIDDFGDISEKPLSYKSTYFSKRSNAPYRLSSVAEKDLSFFVPSFDYYSDTTTMSKAMNYTLLQSLFVNEELLESNYWHVSSKLLACQKHAYDYFVGKHNDFLEPVNQYFSQTLTKNLCQSKKDYLHYSELHPDATTNVMRQAYQQELPKIANVAKVFQSIVFSEILQSTYSAIDTNFLSDKKVILPTVADITRCIDFSLYDSSKNSVVVFSLTFSDTDETKPSFNTSFVGQNNELGKKLVYSDLLYHIYENYNRSAPSISYGKVSIPLSTMQQFATNLFEYIIEEQKPDLDYPSLFNDFQTTPAYKSTDFPALVLKLDKHIKNCLKNGNPLKIPLYE